MVAPTKIHELVERFEANKDYYTSSIYNETQTRREFIEPMFAALGWDVNDSMNVVHEARLYVQENGEERAKHPDIAFRVGNNIRFYVEAKKPSENLIKAKYAFQIRRYGWTQGLSLCVLTDFEEFIIYNCKIKPDKTDEPHIARIESYTYKDYIEKWEEIEDLFGYENVEKGSLEKYVEIQNIFGTISVDEAFLREMEQWREMLAKSIALHNPDLTRRQLNIAVQRTIDRLVFLRICEDRNIEPYARLKSMVRDKGAYERLKKLFGEVNDKYNSGLFHFVDDPDSEVGDGISMKIHIPDRPLHYIVYGMYYPDSPYEFSVFPSDILGQVYERFLGKVITLEKGAATIEEKPEVRKAGGVYYTPTYIVDYIVENTVGKLVKSKNPAQVARLRILDPACGSGSFLIGAYQYLLDWHLQTYIEALHKNPASTFKSRVRETDDPINPYYLKTEEKKRILVNNIYGVDLDQQAVEVTKLSLLLKMLEGETATTVPQQFHLFQSGERILPDLGNNVKWGNTLIGSDFYSGKQIDLFGDEEIYRVKAFDWDDNESGFGSIMRAGGFDAVIGNPPYIRLQTMKETAPETVDYYKKCYHSAMYNYDIYIIFLEKALSLINTAGINGFIVPHKFLNARYGKGIRELIAQGSSLSKIVHFRDEQIFKGATTYTCLVFLEKSVEDNFSFLEVGNVENWRLIDQSISGVIPVSELNEAEWSFVVGHEADVYYKLKSILTTLGDLSHIFVGTQTSADNVFVLEDCEVDGDYVYGFSENLGKKVRVERKIVVPFLRGKQIRAYEPLDSQSLLISPYFISKFDSELIDFRKFQSDFPLTAQYLKENKDVLEDREGGKFAGENWYGFGYPKSMHLFQQEKLIVPDYNNVASFTLDTGGYFYKTGYGIIMNNPDISLHYILGLLNSNLLFKYLLMIGTTLRGGYVRFWTKYIEKLPIRTIDFDNPDDAGKHDAMVRYVERMLDLHKQLSTATGTAKGILEKQIRDTDRKIDRLVYNLYGLTDEEIKIVENT